MPGIYTLQSLGTTVFYSKDSHFGTLNVEQLTEAKDHKINVFKHSPTWTHFHKLFALQSG